MKSPIVVGFLWLSVCILPQFSVRANLKIYAGTIEVEDRILLTSSVNIKVVFTNTSTNQVELIAEVYNSSWSHDLTPKEHDFVTEEGVKKWTWNIWLDRDLFNNPLYIMIPKEQWLLKLLLLDHYENHTTETHQIGNVISTGDFTRILSIIDVRTEPVLQWRIGTLISSPEQVLSQSTAILTTVSPCASDVVLISPTASTTSFSGLFIGVTWSAFDRSVKWFHISEEDALSILIEDGVVCDSLSLLSITLTTHYLLLLTTCGLMVSGDIATIERGHNYQTRMTWRKALGVSSECDQIESGHIIYSPHCICENDPYSIISDFAAVNYMCYNGYESHMISSRNHEGWFNVEDFIDSDQNLSVVNVEYDYETYRLLILVKNQNNRHMLHDINLPQIEQRGGRVLREDISRLLFEFPPGVTFDWILQHPVTQHIYCFGNELWMSFDGGYFFQSVWRGDGNHIRQFTFELHQQAFILQVGEEHLLYGKQGVDRLLHIDYSFTSTDNFLFDHLGNPYKLSLNSVGNVLKERIDIDQFTEAHEVNGQVSLVYSPVDPEQSYLFQLNTGANSTSCFFSDRNIGQLFVQKTGGSEGGSGLIVDVFESTDDRVSCVATLFLIKSFNTQRDLNSDITVGVSNPPSHDVKLTLQDNNSWNRTHIHSTIILEDGVACLLTSLSGEAVTTVPLAQNKTYSAGQWHIISLAVNSLANIIEWSLKERKCKNSATFYHDPGAKSFVDIGDTFQLDGHIVLKDKIPAHLPALHPVGSNRAYFSVQYKLTTSNSVHAFHTHFGLRPGDRKGLLTFNLMLDHSSLLCDQCVISFKVGAGCSCLGKMWFNYPHNISKEDYLSGDPKDEDGFPLLHDLVTNYRPPSELGVGVPTSHLIYNVDFTKPIPNNKFPVSKESVNRDVCERAGCICTEEEILSAEAQDAHCRKRVYRMKFPGTLNVDISMATLNNLQINLDYFTEGQPVFLYEINNRTPIIEGKTSVLDAHIPDRAKHQQHKLYAPFDLSITLNGTGLYHFRVQLADGISFCHLSTEFQIYVEGNKLPYPLIFIVDFSTAVFIGCLIFLVYMIYHSRVEETYDSQSNNS